MWIVGSLFCHRKLCTLNKMKPFCEKNDIIRNLIVEGSAIIIKFIDIVQTCQSTQNLAKHPTKLFNNVIKELNKCTRRISIILKLLSQYFHQYLNSDLRWHGNLYDTFHIDNWKICHPETRISNREGNLYLCFFRDNFEDRAYHWK